MDIIKIAVLGTVGALLGIMLKSQKKEYELFAMLGVSLCIFYFLMSKLNLVISVIDRMQDYVNLDSSYIVILIKMIGITYVSEFSANLCKDAGYQTVAGQIWEAFHTGNQYAGGSGAAGDNRGISGIGF